MIVALEVTSQDVYEKKYKRPIKPGAQSGITVGIGYDCGYVTAAQIAADWGGVIAPAMVKALQGIAGLTGAKAQSALSSVKNKVQVPFSAALIVFSKTSLPKYAAMAAKLPNYESLHPHCKGALVSLVYNRGASFSTAGARYQEMRNIKAHMAARRFTAIPTEFRSMKRLWENDPSVKGLLDRRDQEAALFERGLREAVLTPPVPNQVSPPVPPEPAPPPLPQPSAWAAFFTFIARIFGKAL